MIVEIEKLCLQSHFIVTKANESTIKTKQKSSSYPSTISMTKPAKSMAEEVIRKTTRLSPFNSFSQSLTPLLLGCKYVLGFSFNLGKNQPAFSVNIKNTKRLQPMLRI